MLRQETKLYSFQRSVSYPGITSLFPPLFQAPITSIPPIPPQPSQTFFEAAGNVSLQQEGFHGGNTRLTNIAINLSRKYSPKGEDLMSSRLSDAPRRQVLGRHKMQSLVKSKRESRTQSRKYFSVRQNRSHRCTTVKEIFINQPRRAEKGET